MSDRNLRLEVILAAIDRATGPLKAVMGSSKGMSAAVRNARAELKALEQQNKRLEAFRQTARDVAVTGNAMQLAQSKVKELARQMAATDAPSKAMVRNFEAAKREAAQLKDRNQALTQQQQRLRTELQAAGVPLQGMAKHQAELRRKIDDATGALHRQEAALKAQGARMQRLAAARAQYDKTMNTRNSVAGAGAGALAAGGGALYAGARFAAPGMDFDEQMASVQALTRLEKASAALAELRQQARDLGATISFTATQVGQGQGFLAMAGFDPVAIKAAMPGMLALSKAGRTELAETADIASNILTGFKLSADQTSRLGDVLVGTFTRSNVNLQMLGDTMKYVAPVASGLGQEIEVAAAMAGKLGDAGIQGSMAGTALRAVLSRLAAPPKMAADAIEQLGLKTTDAAGNLRQMPDILADISAKTKGMGDAQRAAIMKAIAGEEAFSALSVLVDQAGSGSLQTLIATLRAAEGEAGKNAATMADNAKGDILGLQSAWEELGITVFETQNGSVRGLIQSVTDVVRGVGRWANEHPALAGALVKTAAVIAVIVAAIGALLLIVSAILGPLAMLKFAVAAIGITAGAVSLPVLAIIAVVAALAAAAYLIYKHWGPIKAWFAGLWDAIKANFNATVDWFGALPARFAEFGTQMMQGLVDGITGAMGRAKDAVMSVGDNVVGWFKDKLGIHSPSRVFAELGGFTMAGLAQGLQAGAGGPLAAIARTGRALVAATGVGLAGVVTAGQGGIAIDNRPPLAAPTSAGAWVGQSINYITINAAPGMDEQVLARAVAAELDRRDRAKAARSRSRLSDRY